MSQRQKDIDKLGLGDKQRLFARLFMALLEEIHRCGYQVVLEEGKRTKAQAHIYAAQGKGIPNSLHIIKLAHDISLFDKNGKYPTATKDYTRFGIYWEKLGGAWGGRFNDGGHFSLMHKGVK